LTKASRRVLEIFENNSTPFLSSMGEREKDTKVGQRSKGQSEEAFDRR